MTEPKSLSTTGTAKGQPLSQILKAQHGPIRALKNSLMHTHNPTGWAQGPKAPRKGLLEHTSWGGGGKRSATLNPSS